MAERTLEFGEDKVANAAVKRAIVTTISMMGERARQATVSMTGRVTVGTAAGALVPPSISMWRDHYEARARSINNSLLVLNGHYAEIDSYLNSGPARAPDMISADIRRVKAELNDHIANLSHAYAGVTMERELPRGACYEVFEYEHMRLLRSWTMLATLPDGIRP